MPKRPSKHSKYGEMNRLVVKGKLPLPKKSQADLDKDRREFEEMLRQRQKVTDTIVGAVKSVLSGKNLKKTFIHSTGKLRIPVR